MGYLIRIEEPKFHLFSSIHEHDFGEFVHETYEQHCDLQNKFKDYSQESPTLYEMFEQDNEAGRYLEGIIAYDLLDDGEMDMNTLSDEKYEAFMEVVISNYHDFMNDIVVALNHFRYFYSVDDKLYYNKPISEVW